MDFHHLTASQRAAAATILREALAHLPSAYNAPGEAEAEVELRGSDADWLGYAALIDDRPVGWIGALKTYSHAWEVHPLVVEPNRQRQRIGSALLAHLEERGRGDGGRPDILMVKPLRK